MDTLFHDDFRGGLRGEGPDAAWQIRTTAYGPGGDGTVRGHPDRVEIAPVGRHPATGEPAFTPLGDPEPPTAFIRWMAVVRTPGAEHFETDGISTLTSTAELAVRVSGAEAPDGAAAASINDLRAGAGGLIAYERPSGLVFDLALGRRWIHAVYERLPLPGTDYRAYSYAVPVALVRPDAFHRCSISLNPAEGAVTWIVDGEAVLRVDEIGSTRFDDEHLLWERPGRPETVRPQRLGFGLATMASAARGQGVRLGVRRFAVAAELAVPASRLTEGGVR
jgi:hypothetical protein